MGETPPPGPPHPGPPPPAFRFPFSEAAAAAAASEALLEAIDAAVESQVAAATGARVGFEGATRQRFDHALEGTLDDLGRLRRQLAADVGMLEDDVVTARRRAADAEETQQRWQDAQRRWQAHAGAGGRSR